MFNWLRKVLRSGFSTAPLWSKEQNDPSKIAIHQSLLRKQHFAPKGAFPLSHFSNKHADKLAHKVALQTNVTHLCLVSQSEVCFKPNWFATNSPRQL
jgi:hypothetical protein